MSINITLKSNLVSLVIFTLIFNSTFAKWLVYVYIYKPTGIFVWSSESVPFESVPSELDPSESVPSELSCSEPVFLSDTFLSSDSLSPESSVLSSELVISDSKAASAASSSSSCFLSSASSWASWAASFLSFSNNSSLNLITFSFFGSLVFSSSISFSKPSISFACSSLFLDLKNWLIFCFKLFFSSGSIPNSSISFSFCAFSFSRFSFFSCFLFSRIAFFSAFFWLSSAFFSAFLWALSCLFWDLASLLSSSYALFWEELPKLNEEGDLPMKDILLDEELSPDITILFFW